MRFLLSALAAAALLSACAAKRVPVVTEDAAPPAARAEPAEAKVVTPPASEQTEAKVEGPIYYALDSAQLTPDGQRILNELADQLRRHPGWSVRLDGHTCELGTSEYNLELGQRRAATAQTYLQRLGVATAQVSILSYGEERPAVQGDDEDAHQKNRRTELSLNSGDGK